MGSQFRAGTFRAGRCTAVRRFHAISSGRSSRERSGFTVTEMVMVVVILAIMAMVAIPSFTTMMTKQTATAAVDKVVNDLRSVQGGAVTVGHVRRLHSGNDPLVPAQYRNQYCLEESTDGGVTWVAMGNWYSLARDYKGAALGAIKASDGAGVTVYEVRYSSQGVLDTGGGMPAYPLQISITTGSGTRTIRAVGGILQLL